jgi:hypothetical protein
MSVELVQLMSQLLNLVMFIQIFTHVKFAENKTQLAVRGCCDNELTLWLSVSSGKGHDFFLYVHSRPVGVHKGSPAVTEKQSGDHQQPEPEKENINKLLASAYRCNFGCIPFPKCCHLPLA